jgi:diguanylate cyclase (GGDEF)-like protein/PAS domain S-box-containing protein
MPRPPARSPTPMTEELRVLIVDDDEALRFLARMGLEAAGWTVAEATSGASCLAAMESVDPDVVLLDLCLPDGDGVSVLAELKKTERTAWVPVVILSGESNPSEVIRLLLAGAQDYLVKPFPSGVLHARLIAARRVSQEHRRLAASERELRLLAENTTDLVVRCGIDGIIRYVSPSAYPLLGWRPEDLVGTRAVDLCHPDDDAPAVALRSATSGEAVTVTRRVLRADGGYVWVESVARLVVDPSGKDLEIQSSMRDVTRRLADAAALASLALDDELTGLHNRRGFVTLADHQLKMAARAGRTTPLLFVDVDGMKAINDTLGHTVGDQALVDVAQFLRASCRAWDLIARIGGDEFCILLIDDGTGPVSADRTTAKLRSGPPKGVRPYSLTLSVGVAHLAPGSGTIEELMEQADAAMYEDKTAARRLPRVLVVEDDPIVRRLTELSLRHRYEVVTAVTGGEGLDKAEALRPDLVLLDLGLPDMTGSEVLRRLRAAPATSQVQVIVMTAAVGRDTELESLREGVDDFVTKPLDIPILMARIDSVLQRSRTRPRRLSA